MKKNNKLTAFAVIAALSTQAISGTAFAISDAQRIATAQKEEILTSKRKLIDELEKIKTQLKMVKKELKIKEDVDYSILASRTNIAAGLAAAGLMAITAITLKNKEDLLVSAIAFQASSVSLAASHILALIDIGISSDVDQKEFEKQMSEALASLSQLEQSLSSEKDKLAVRLLMLDIASVNKLATKESKQEKLKNILVKSSLAMTGIAIATVAVRKWNTSGTLETAILTISGSLSAASAFIGEDKKLILDKIETALDAADTALAILRAE